MAKKELEFHNSYVAIDIETTGLSPNFNDIIELAAIVVEEGKIVFEYQQLVNPGYPIDSFITALTGITDQMVKNSPTINQVIEEFYNLLAGKALLGHNIRFDLAFINYNLSNTIKKRLENQVIDTMYISRRMFPEYSHHRLSDLVSRFSLNKIEHRAKSDALMCHKCYQYMKEKAETKV